MTSVCFKLRSTAGFVWLWGRGAFRGAWGVRCVVAITLVWIATMPAPAQEDTAADGGPVLLYSFDDKPKVFALDGQTFTAESVVSLDHVGWRFTGIGGDASHDLWPVVDMTETFAGVAEVAVDLKVNDGNRAKSFTMVLENNYAADDQNGLILSVNLTGLAVGEAVTVRVLLPSPVPNMTQTSTYKIKHYGSQPMDVEVYDFYLPGPDDASDTVDEPD